MYHITDPNQLALSNQRIIGFSLTGTCHWIHFYLILPLSKQYLIDLKLFLFYHMFSNNTTYPPQPSIMLSFVHNVS